MMKATYKLFVTRHSSFVTRHSFYPTLPVDAQLFCCSKFLDCVNDLIPARPWQVVPHIFDNQLTNHILIAVMMAQTAVVTISLGFAIL